jgi:anti-sigma B factor antagonist
MQLEERTVGDVTVIKVTGDITLSSGGDVLLKDKVQSLLQQGKKKLLLDLGSVAYVDSGGLGQLVQCNVTASKNGGSLKLLNMTKRLNDLLVLTKLATIFDSHDTEDAAIKSFSLKRGRHGAAEAHRADALCLLPLLINAAALCGGYAAGVFRADLIHGRRARRSLFGVALVCSGVCSMSCSSGPLCASSSIPS